MNGFKFIDLYGYDKAKRIVCGVVYDAEYYSEKTGSYYSSKTPDCVKIKDLKNAMREYETLMHFQESYLTRLEHWNISVMKGDL